MARKRLNDPDGKSKSREKAAEKFEAQRAAGEPVNEEQELQELASLPPIEYGKIRKATAKNLGVTVTILDQDIEARRKLIDQEDDEENTFLAPPEPWEKPVYGEDLLDDLVEGIQTYVALADRVGGEWPRRARDAAQTLSEAEPDEDTIRTMLLEDIHNLFNGWASDRMTSKSICEALVEQEGRPWPEFKNTKPITPRQVARLLAPFKIKPLQVWVDGRNSQGYERTDFDDAFKRYLPPETPDATPRTLDRADSKGSSPKTNPRREKNLGDKKARKAPDSKGSRGSKAAN